MWKQTIRRVLQRSGYEISRTGTAKKTALAASLWPASEDSERAIAAVRPNTMVALPGLISLYEQALYCERAGIPGAFVECGVWKGGSIGLMAWVNLHHGRERRPLHLFDSFQEICEPDAAVDGDRAVREAQMWSTTKGTSGRLEPLKGFYDAKGGPGTVEENRRLLEQTIGYDPALVHIHQGWFQDTMPTARDAIGPIALLRIDADWYASTKTCLDHLAALVQPGGVIVIDDYGAYEGCRLAVDEYLAVQRQPPFLNRVNAEIRYWFVRGECA